MEKKELPIPKELLKDVEDIHDEMLKKFSDDISTLPGEFVYDATRAAAEQIAMTREMMIHYLIMKVFTKSSDGDYLDYIGEMNSVFRKKATKSVGKLIFTGTQGTVIPKGTIVSTEGSEQINAITFITTDGGEIPESGSIEIDAECVESGVKGNVKVGMIKVLVNNITNISSVSNKEFKNGTDIEDDEKFRERIEFAEKEEQLSGADTDYERWAKEIDGVGYAYCRDSWNSPGTVKILILDKNRKPATSELIKKVKEYIYPDIKEGQYNRGGKAPTGIKSFSVLSPSVKEVSIKGNFVISKGFNETNVLNDVRNKINTYFDKLDIEGSISYNMVNSIIGTLLVNNQGLDDFENITINDTKSNIKLNNEIANVSEVVKL